MFATLETSDRASLVGLVWFLITQGLDAQPATMMHLLTHQQILTLARDQGLGGESAQLAVTACFDGLDGIQLYCFLSSFFDAGSAITYHLHKHTRTNTRTHNTHTHTHTHTHTPSYSLTTPPLCPNISWRLTSIGRCSMRESSLSCNGFLMDRAGSHSKLEWHLDSSTMTPMGGMRTTRDANVASGSTGRSPSEEHKVYQGTKAGPDQKRGKPHRASANARQLRLSKPLTESGLWATLMTEHDGGYARHVSQELADDPRVKEYEYATSWFYTMRAQWNAPSQQGR
jgi:hypothetical protein